MSYCRIGEGSDVYVVGTRQDGQDGIECVSCEYDERGYFWAATPSSMIAHLLVHRLRGDRVPDRALDRLRDERDGVLMAVPDDAELEAAFRRVERLIDTVATNAELAQRARQLDAHTVVRNWLDRHVGHPPIEVDTRDEWLNWLATNFLADPEIAMHLRPVDQP